MDKLTFDTVEKFESWYANNSRVPVDWLHKHGRYGAPCNCGEDGCTGWQMTKLSKEVYHG